MPKKKKEEWKVYENVFDEFTIKNLQKLMGQKIIEGVESPVKIGKEANIFTTNTAEAEKRILKIYRLESCNFNKMFKYIQSDPRFIGIKKQRRQVIFSWVKREYKNLLKARQAGVRVPTPFAIMYNVIVLEFIGENSPAPQLKDELPQNMERFLEDIVKNIKLLYKKGGLVHADLSEHNILNFNGKPVLIDFSQSTTTKDFAAKDYLKRDLDNLKRYFSKLGVNVDSEKLFTDITQEN